MSTWWVRLRSLFRPREMDRQLAQELRFHVQMETEANIARGMPPDAARGAALRAFGDVARVTEDVRDTWLLRWVETLLQDLRFGTRMLRRSPGFTAAVIATMALGIGANTAIFSVIDGVLLRPLPFERGHDLLVLRQQRPAAGDQDLRFSFREIEDYRAGASTLEGIAEFHDMWFILLGRDEPERVATGVVSANFFDVLGVRPLAGRTFRPGDDEHGAEAALVLSYGFWQRSFGGDPHIVGRVFRMNDRPHTVIGVLPPFPQFPAEMDVYMPTSACPFRSRPVMHEDRQARMMRVIARRRPGVPLEAVQADLAVVAGRIAGANGDAYPAGDGYAIAATPLRDELTRGFRPTLVVLLGSAGFVLLIVCASVANLLVARLVRRRGELALRAALGARRIRLLRQLLTESTLLAVAGGALGLAIAWWGLHLLVAYAERFTPRAAEVAIDARVLLFTLGLSVLTGLLFGAIPALGTRGDALAAVKDEGTRVAGGSHGLRSALVVAQIAVSFMLLIGAGLMLRSLGQLQALDPGFRVDRVLTARTDLNFTKYRTPAERAHVIGALLERLEAEPGIESVAASATFPLNEDGVFTGQFVIEGRPVPPGTPQPRAQVHLASPDYFRSIGIPLLRGRVFTRRDNLQAPETTVVVNQALARRYWPERDPLGARISFDRGETWNRIVGIVGDARQQIDREAGEAVYGPILRTGQLSVTWLIRAQGDPARLAPRVRAIVHAVDPEQPVDRFRTLEDVRAAAIAPWKLTATLVGLFAGVALVITAIGLAGVIAFSVNGRVQEFGVRMALGAGRATVVSMVLRQAAVLVGIGLVIGAIGALLVTRVLASVLFGVTPTDGTTFLAVSALLAVVAAAACAIPARRAASVDPVIALRTV